MVAATILCFYFLTSKSVESRARNAYTAFEKRDWSRLYDSFSSFDVSKKEISEAQFATMMNFLVDDTVQFSFAQPSVQNRSDATGFRMAEATFAKISSKRSKYVQYFGMFFDGEKWSPTLCEAVFNGARLRARSNIEMYKLIRDAMVLANVQDIKQQANGVRYDKDHMTEELQKLDFKSMNFALPFR